MASEQAQSSAVTTVPDTVHNYIDGEWRTVDADQGQDVVNPASDESLAYVPFSDAGTVDEAVAAARAAFPEWRAVPPGERVQYLFDLKQELEERQDEIARVLTQEHGKTLAEASGEVRRGIENVDVATGIPNMLREGSGNVEGVAPNIDEYAIRQPLGVFAAITPFNFPAMIPLWFLPHAVATGNTFILKPSERDPLTSQLLFEAVDAVDFPDGVVNLVNGSTDTVNTLLEHDGIEGISFVGSSSVAKHVYETAAANGKRVQAQGGAKNYAVVAESADLDQAVPNVVGSVYGNAGQRCLANDVVVGIGTVYDDLRTRLLDEVEALTVGDGLDEGTDITPLITKGSAERVVEMIEAAVDQGADLLVDGREHSAADYPAGNYLGPTILEGVTTDMDIAQTEIFGPVLCLSQADSLADAIEMVNSTDYGNASTLYTERGAEARKYRYEVEAGNIGINVGVCAPMGFFHFGGRKDSFFGDLHAQGEDAVSFFTDKTVAIERYFGD